MNIHKQFLEENFVNNGLYEKLQDRSTKFTIRWWLELEQNKVLVHWACLERQAVLAWQSDCRRIEHTCKRINFVLQNHWRRWWDHLPCEVRWRGRQLAWVECEDSCTYQDKRIQECLHEGYQPIQWSDAGCVGNNRQRRYKEDLQDER